MVAAPLHFQGPSANAGNFLPLGFGGRGGAQHTPCAVGQQHAGQLRLDGLAVGRRRVTRLMRMAGLQGRSARLYRHSKVLQRAFFASVPYRPDTTQTQASDQVWVGDVTYLKVAGKWRYNATRGPACCSTATGASSTPPSSSAKLARLGMLQSMNRAGKMNDNAHMESFFHSMRTQELYGKTFADDRP